MKEHNRPATQHRDGARCGSCHIEGAELNMQMPKERGTSKSETIDAKIMTSFP